MRLRYFAIPIRDDGSGADELNAFLASHRVTSFTQELVREGGLGPVWAVSVVYEEQHAASRPASRASRIDYKEILAPEEFAVYDKLRQVRKAVAEKTGIPRFAVFENAQLAAFVQNRVTTPRDMAGISGVGPKRMEKHVGPFLEVLAVEIPKLVAAVDAGEESSVTSPVVETGAPAGSREKKGAEDAEA